MELALDSPAPADPVNDDLGPNLEDGQRANPGRPSQFSSCLWRFGYTRPGSPGRLRGIHPPKDLNSFDGALHPGVRGSAWPKRRPGRSSTENPSSLVAVSRPEFCGVWFSWFWWFSVVTVSGSPGWCREPRRLRARRGAHADSGVGPDDAHPEDPLGGGDYGRRQCAGALAKR